MLKPILVIAGILIVLILAGLAGWVWLQPTMLHLERKGGVDAPPDVVFDVASNLRTWPTWWKSGELAGKGKTIPGGPEEGAGQLLKIDVPGAPITLVSKRLDPNKEVDIDIMASDYVYKMAIKLEPNAGGTTMLMTIDREMTYGEKVFEHLGGGLSKLFGARMATGMTEMRVAAEAKK